MSYRGEPDTVLKLIGSLTDRIKVLERGNTGVKQQNVRVEDQLIEEGPTDNTLKVTDLSSGTSFILPQQIPPSSGVEEVFWSENVTMEPLQTNNVLAGPWIAPYNLQITKIIVSFNFQLSSIFQPNFITFYSYKATPPIYSDNAHSPFDIQTTITVPSGGVDLIAKQIDNSTGWENNTDNSSRFLSTGESLSWIIIVSNAAAFQSFIPVSIQLFYIPML